MDELLQETEGSPEKVLRRIKTYLANILKKKQRDVKWKLKSVKEAFETEVRQKIQVP